MNLVGTVPVHPKAKPGRPQTYLNWSEWEQVSLIYA